MSSTTESAPANLPPVVPPSSALGASSGPGSRTYNRAVANETLEDYSLRYAPKSFRRWSEFTVASTALGGIAYLADFSIGASIAVTHGFANAVAAVLVAAVTIFLTGIPIAYYSAKHSIDMDLLTRAAGFGYLGSTITSVVYASFTFIFFALEGSIMAQAFELGFGMPLWLGYLVASLVVLPIVVFGMTAMAKLQVWTQPILAGVDVRALRQYRRTGPGRLRAVDLVRGSADTGSTFTWLGAGLGMGVALSLIAQIGEQVRMRPLPEMISVDGPITRSGCTPSIVSGFPALPRATIRPSRMPTSALITPQWSSTTAPVITVSGAPSARVARPCPMDSRSTLPPPNTASSPARPGPPHRSSVTSISRSVSARRIRSPVVGPYNSA